MRRFVWGFPGVGKSNVSSDLKIIDADCELFKFLDVTLDRLHNIEPVRQYVRNEEYPQNYFDYIKSVDADVVLINCHLSLLNGFDREQLLVIYPCKDFMDEYLKRYQSRGDCPSFISYMANEWDGIIDYIKSTGFEKYEIVDSGVCLNDLFERNDFKMKVMTRNEIRDSIQRAMDLKVIDTNPECTELVCSLDFVDSFPPERRINDAGVWAEAVIDGEYSLDIDQLEKVCSQREAIVEQEKIAFERRGGLSREELEDKIMQGIVNGALYIHHGQIAPYSYGFEVQFQSDDAGLSGKNRWECYCDLFDVPGIIAQKIEQGTQNRAVFGAEVPPFNISTFISTIDEAEKHKLVSFTPEKDTDLKRAKNSYTYPYRSDVAGLRDVHSGRGLDGIAKGHYGGDYSTMTTSSQNDMIQTLVFLKGFCLDCLNHLHSRPGTDNVITYLKKHGTDITTPEKLKEWIKANPEKCGMEENRRISLDAQIAKGAAKKNEREIHDKSIDRGNQR